MVCPTVEDSDHIFPVMRVLLRQEPIFHSLYPRPTKLEGGYTGFTLSVRLSVDDMVSGP